MEWNPKTPLVWDWEGVELFNGRLRATPKQEQPTDLSVEEARGNDAGPLYPSGGGVCSGSDFGNGSSSKSSITASVDSLLKTGIEEPEFNFQSLKGIPEDVNSRKELGTGEVAENSLNLLASVGNEEPLVGQKLGKRTSFEDLCCGGAIEASSNYTTSASSSNPTKKTRAYSQSLQTPRCKVEGCNIDLTEAKDYHRRHGVCENHTKHPKVIVGGQERRFCQQCSRFHGLSEFDEKKRSCRRRLPDHNARRRRPQKETISFNSSMLSSSFYDRRQQMNFASNCLPSLCERPAINTTSLSDFKIAQAKWSWMGIIRTRGIDGDLHLPSSECSTAIPVICHDFDKFIPCKQSSIEVLNQGREASMIAFNLNITLDPRRALSFVKYLVRFKSTPSSY